MNITIVSSNRMFVQGLYPDQVQGFICNGIETANGMKMSVSNSTLYVDNSYLNQKVFDQYYRDHIRRTGISVLAAVGALVLLIVILRPVFNWIETMNHPHP